MDPSDSKLPIALRTLRLNTALDFDLFIKSEGEQRFVLYRNKDRDFDIKARDRLIDAGVQHLFINEKDQSSYRAYAERHLGSVVDDNDVAITEKASIVYEIATTVTADLLQFPLSHTKIMRTSAMTDSAARMASIGRDAVHELVRLMGTEESARIHAVNVCVLALSVAIQLGLSDSEVRAVGLAGLFHDLGEATIPLTVRKKRRPNRDEIILIRNHPAQGVRLLANAGLRDGRVLSAVAQHHESFDGTGYPKQLSGNNIDRGARIVAIVDRFDELTSGHRGQRKFLTFDAIQKMISGESRKFDPKIFQAFIRLLGPTEKGTSRPVPPGFSRVR